jgi:hypothetical protein
VRWIFYRHWLPSFLLALGVLAVFNSLTLYWRPPAEIEPTIAWSVRAGLLGIAAVGAAIFLLKMGL